MNARTRNALVLGFAAITTLAAAATSMAGLLDLFISTKPPVHVRVRMDSSGFDLRQNFRIKKYCSYEFALRLLHTQNRMGEFDAVLTNDSLPISATVEVYRLNGERTERVYHLSGTPRLTGKAPSMTILGMGKATLDEGRYRMEVSSTGEAPQLAGIEADFVVQIRPKTNCPDKRD